MIRRYIGGQNRNTDNSRLRTIVQEANVAALAGRFALHDHDELTVADAATLLRISRLQVRRRLTSPYTRAKVQALLDHPPSWLTNRHRKLARQAARIEVSCTVCRRGDRVDPYAPRKVLGFLCSAHIPLLAPLDGWVDEFPAVMRPPAGKALDYVGRTGSRRLHGWRFRRLAPEEKAEHAAGVERAGDILRYGIAQMVVDDVAIAAGLETPPRPQSRRQPDHVTYVTDRKGRIDWVTKPVLKTRGWTDAGIRRFLGEPGGYKVNPHYAATSPMAVWSVAQVAAVEAPESWQAWLAASLARRNTTLEQLCATNDERMAQKLAATAEAIRTATATAQ